MCTRQVLTGFDIVPLDFAGWRRFRPQIMAIESASYESVRCATPDFFEGVVSHPSAMCLAALRSGRVIGFCFGAQLEAFAEEYGVRSDPELHRFTTFYSADVTVDRAWRGHGIGWLLKARQVELAREAGYRYIAGRARVGVAEVMRSLNAKFGAREIQYFPDYYSDDVGRHDMSYYHIDLCRVSGETSRQSVLLSLSGDVGTASSRRILGGTRDVS